MMEGADGGARALGRRGRGGGAGCGAGTVSLLLLENMAACLYEIVRVLDDIVVPDFVMDMRPGAASGRADPAEPGALGRHACPPAR